MFRNIVAEKLCQIRDSILIRSLMLALLAVLFSSPAPATEYFVDKTGLGGTCNDAAVGTQEAPWCAIAKANSTLQPGDIVSIRSGSYDDVIEPQHSGKPQNPISYRAFPGDAVNVRGRPGKFQVVNIGGFNTDWQPKSYIIIDGIRIERGSPDLLDSTRHTLISIYGSESSHNVIRNCTLIGTDQPLPAVWNEGAGLRVGGISISKSSYNLIENNTIQNMTFMGILVGDTPRPRFNIIRNNHIANVIQDGIHTGTKEGDDTILGLLIEGNEIHGSLISDGIQADGCGGVDVPANCSGVAGVIVRNNRIYNNAENNIDLKGTRYWVIENNILFGAAGNNDGGLKARLQEDCSVPPCNNVWGGTNIGKGGNRYSRDIIMRNNVIYDGNGGVIIWDGYIIYNNTILNNRRTFTGPNQQVCITDSCSRKPDFPGVYGPGEDSVIINNILGDNGFAVSRWYNPKWHIDHNLYYWSRPEPFKGLAHFLDKGNWQGFTLDGWRQHLKQCSEVTGSDEHSFVGLTPVAIFRQVGFDPFGDNAQFDFSLAPLSPAVDAGCPLTQTVNEGIGKSVTVKDARFFNDGYGVTDGDLIVVGRNQPVRIIKIDYSTNALLLADEVSWKTGDPVSLPFAGKAPDMGARETKFLEAPSDLELINQFTAK